MFSVEVTIRMTEVKGHLVNCMILRIKLNTHDVSINLIEDLE